MPSRFSCIAVALSLSLCGMQSLISLASDADSNRGFVPAEPSTAREIFGQTIRETPHLAPKDEQAGFHVPAGFEVDLVASEPTIAKPMNLAFDSKGRLWVTQSTQYPYPAKGDEKGSDAIVVLEDKDQNGSFESSHKFADGLNIPIGMLPYGDGALCFSIPNILFLHDKDGDGVCDEREVVLGPFDTTRDTHGMVNSMHMGADGWVYACHGFNNQSTVAGRDGHSVSMTSGNVFRFRPDGSRVELYSQGQVNPFGLARDRWGFWYAADCHSKPISQLIRGGCYPSFGRPDDGLGFVPPMMEHLHDSTAIAGLAHTMNSRFPKAFQDNFVSGNVMTCRINRNHIEYQGSTAKAVEMPDLLTSEDPWFRPVDLQFGPDGHLYIADFYNKVIGHYEVPLDHPGRDRTSGRIWRIRWAGGGDVLSMHSDDGSQKIKNLLSMDLSQWSNGRVLDRSTMEELLKADMVPTQDAIGRQFLNVFFQNAIEIVTRPENRAANQALQSQTAEWLLRQVDRFDAGNDPVLFQTILIGLRDTLTELKKSDPKTYETWVRKTCEQMAGASKSSFAIDQPKVRALMRVLLAVKDSSAVLGVLHLVERQITSPNATKEQSQLVQEAIQSLAEVASDSEMERFLSVMEKTNKDSSLMADHLLSIGKRQLQQRGKVLESLVQRGQSTLGGLAEEWMKSVSPTKGSTRFSLASWTALGTKNGDYREWNTETREHNHSPGLFFSSLSLGESYTGIWSTSPFAAPSEIRFGIVGHNGMPAESDHQKNYVSLVSLDALGNVIEEIQRAYPPRSDIAKQITWDLSPHAGKSLQIRVVDGDTANAYAWIGFGECNLAGINPGPIRNQWQRIASFIEVFGWPTQPIILQKISLLLDSDVADWPMRLQLIGRQTKGADADIAELIEFASEHYWYDMVEMSGVMSKPLSKWNWQSVDANKRLEIAKAICQRCSFKEQEQLVVRLSKHRIAWPMMATLCEKGTLSRDSLRALPKNWWESLPQDGSAAIVAMRPEPQTESARLAIVESKAAQFETLKPDLAIGAKMFTEKCAVCHKLGDQGKVIGPQLEGIGARGIARLSEDILWPDRNVDEAFRMSILILDGGETVNGLVSDRTSDSLLLTDQTGKQRRILLADIEQEKHSKLSLMPGNFEETMNDKELSSLIGYLRNAAAKKQ